MQPATRLASFAGGLALIFVAAAVAAGAIVPSSVADSWTSSANRSGTEHTGDPMHDSTAHSGDHARGHSDARHAATAPQGVALERGGYRLADLNAPATVGRRGALTFRILDADSRPVVTYTRTHEKDLHLIVVRSDGAGFRHLHPTLDDTGRWSVPLTWPTAGSYRVYADFTAAGARTGVTLSRSVEVAGQYRPDLPAEPSRTSSVDGFDVTLSGQLEAGAEADLTITVSRDGQPVTTGQPYLGAFGHLVVLRQGDLAFLHVHPQGAEPTPGRLSGPEIDFMTDVPTPGRYLLYLDFRVDDQVHTATFVLDAR
ncbi:MAG: heavy-metal-associated domain-containing protein [Microlunatus sp.]|nr:heavy-metal-associated domain-containing protein [Microlunatus sp.]